MSELNLASLSASQTTLIASNPLESTLVECDLREKRITESRKRNREAVARSRARKKSRLLQLEGLVEHLRFEKTLLTQKLIVSVMEKEAAESRKNDLRGRIDVLEGMISQKDVE